MAYAAALLLLRGAPLLRARIPRAALPRRSFASGLSAADEPQSRETAASASEGTHVSAKGPSPSPPLTPSSKQWADHPEYKKWKDREEEILDDIEPITILTKEILHSDRYRDGERLNDEDEKVVVEKLLAYHPHSEDKIGCGLDSIMVDRHPQFRNSRCLFVVRTDGVWIDFSYQKCLRAYIREKYPSHAERFIREHFKRG
ncbi:protein DCL homolog, chloroplastic [Elaeis guineensis]|uniref:Protein DCL homolog, chloroplastic n=1 Tax=Elaeis guineensis var. tenera TaxID=51953 RepID=A0A6I9SH21_ELAGV|nr:protein DCL homolog, chloroplastic [Elaeis guineensis]